jgi:hypothetical protein
MEFEGIYAYHESGCYVEICQWCGELCFAGVNVSLDVHLPQIPNGRGLCHYGSNKSFMEGQFTVSVQSITFELGICAHKCSVGLCSNHFYV